MCLSSRATSAADCRGEARSPLQAFLLHRYCKARVVAPRPHHLVAWPTAATTAQTAERSRRSRGSSRRCRSSASSVGSNSTRLQQVLDRIDALNSEDPNKAQWQGHELPYQVAYSRWVGEWVRQLEPNPSEELLIVAHGQHVQRWKSPRSNFPEGKPGYFKWREGLKCMHAETVAGLMQEAGYPTASMEHVKRLILKQDLKKDPENQVSEDALCLVFLEHQFDGMLDKEGDDKMVDIVRKTWNKMGDRGHAAALELASRLTPRQRAVVEKAVKSR